MSIKETGRALLERISPYQNAYINPSSVSMVKSTTEKYMFFFYKISYARQGLKGTHSYVYTIGLYLSICPNNYFDPVFGRRKKQG